MCLLDPFFRSSERLGRWLELLFFYLADCADAATWHMPPTFDSPNSDVQASRNLSPHRVVHAFGVCGMRHG
jgi:hypothetical protein